jgi:hypothetical protein
MPEHMLEPDPSSMGMATVWWLDHLLISQYSCLTSIGKWTKKWIFTIQWKNLKIDWHQLRRPYVQRGVVGLGHERHR